MLVLNDASLKHCIHLHLQVCGWPWSPWWATSCRSGRSTLTWWTAARWWPASWASRRSSCPGTSATTSTSRCRVATSTSTTRPRRRTWRSSCGCVTRRARSYRWGRLDAAAKRRKLVQLVRWAEPLVIHLQPGQTAVVFFFFFFPFFSEQRSI